MLSIISIYYYSQKIKMIASQQSYNGSIAQSLAFQDDENTAQTPTFKVNVLSFKHLPRAFSRSFSDFGDMNIDDSVHQQSPQPQNKAYKCYKCFGVDKDTKNHKCRQCEGSQYIAQNHPIVAIMEQIIKKKIPNLPKRAEQQKKQQNKRGTLQLQYGCRDAIKEQSFSYQQQMPLICNSCKKQCDLNYYRTCEKCSDYNICENCFSKKRFSHIHPLVLKDISKMPSKMSFMPSNLKKYQDPKQSEPLQFLQQNRPKCCNCHQLIDICYQVCTDCQKKGIKYQICNKCCEDSAYSHNPYHEFQLRTFSQLSQINLALSNHSITHQNLELNSISNRISNSNKKSRIRANNDWLNSSQSESENRSNPFQSYMPEEVHFNLTDHLYDEDLLIFKNKQSKTEQIIPSFQHQQEIQLQDNSSFMGIDMSSSLQLHKNEDQPFSPISRVLKSIHASPKETNPEEEYIFNDYKCDICGVQPIKNKRFHCKQCEDFDLCQSCFLTRLKSHFHKDFDEINGKELLKQRKSILEVSQSKIVQLKNSSRLKQSINLQTRNK